MEKQDILLARQPIYDRDRKVIGYELLFRESNGTLLTNFDGNYSIKAKEGDILVFSFMGMNTLERRVESSNQVNVTMEESAEALEEVVVTALGIKREKASIGSATTIVSSEELNQSSQTNLADAIKGKVAGVVISSASTDPGSSSGVIIRGFSTIFQQNHRHLFFEKPYSIKYFRPE